MTKHILTQDELKSQLHYDPITGIFTRLTKAGSAMIGDVAGYMQDGYIKIRVGKKRQNLAHRLAWFYVHGFWPKKFIDHKNGIRDDNRLVNLREATKSQNQQNIKKANADNLSTGLLGASLHKPSGKYSSRISINGKNVNLGMFATAEEAHQNYLTTKRKHHEFCTI